MAKGKYTSSIENQVVGFINTDEEVSGQSADSSSQNNTAAKTGRKKSVKSETSTPEKKEVPVPAERIEASDMDDSNLCRQTYYCTYEEICALKKISYDEMIGVSELVRELLDEGLERRYPGIFKEVKSQVVRYKSKKSSRI